MLPLSLASANPSVFSILTKLNFEKIVGKEILAQKAIILNDRRLLAGDR
ncbi:hypothetical protein [Microcystis aeruginosa]|nr:hypothetical protein [Microcystis aeruginosa]